MEGPGKSLSLRCSWLDDKRWNQIEQCTRRSNYCIKRSFMKFSVFSSLSIRRPFIYPCEKDWRWNPGPLKDFDLWAVLSGRGEIRITGESRPLRAGSCLILQPGDAPVARHDASHPLIVFACHFRLGQRNGRPKRFTKGIIHAEMPEGELLRVSADRAARVFDEGESGRKLAAILVHQIVAQLFHARMRQAEGARPSLLSSLALEIRSQPARPWTISAMAKRCAMSPAHLNRRFRAAFGVPPLQYVIQYRVRRAVTLLRESDLSLAQIAGVTGYQDVFFFHRQFRHVAGATPRAVRFGEKTKLDEPPPRVPAPR
jgi:AraC-like DNA-binding protein